jgi:hypothetical protein
LFLPYFLHRSQQGLGLSWNVALPKWSAGHNPIAGPLPEA